MRRPSNCRGLRKVLRATYQQKTIKREGRDKALSAQFGCIMFHPSRYEGWVKLTPAMKNKWSGGWASGWFYCRIPLHKSEARGKGVYLLHSEMSALDYLMEAHHSCTVDDVNAMAFEEATKIIGGHDAAEEYLVYGILRLSDVWSPEMERMEAPLLKVIVSLPTVAVMIGEKEAKAAFEVRIAITARQSIKLV
jgi:hypothetical protein